MKDFIFGKVYGYWPATFLKYELPNKYFTKITRTLFPEEFSLAASFE